ncbi:MAG: sulfur carrier protein ThiS [Rikenellaceae bacterium]
MNIVVNNQTHTIKSQTLVGLIEELSIETLGVAIALNNKVVPRAEWSEVSLADGDKIVIVSAVFGG